jgi:hypothetical protein
MFKAVKINKKNFIYLKRNKLNLWLNDSKYTLENQKKSYYQQMIVVKMFTLFMILSFFAFQASNATWIVASGKNEINILMLF